MTSIKLPAYGTNVSVTARETSSVGAGGQSGKRARVTVAVSLSFAFLGLSEVAGAKPFMDYIKPRPITCSALSSETRSPWARIPGTSVM